MLVAVIVAQAAEGITVDFKVKNQVAANVALVYHMSVNEHKLTPDGEASIEIKGLDALYAQVYYGEKSRTVYLQQGDKVMVSFDAADFDNTFSVTGGNEKANAYLGRMQLVGLPDQTYAQPFAAFKASVNEKINSMIRLLKVRKFEKNDKFEKMEEGRITYFYASALLMYPVSHMYMTGDTTAVQGKDYMSAVKKYVREDDDLADLDEYRNFMIEAAHLFDDANRHVRQLYPKTLAEMNYIGSHVKSEKVRESLIHFLAFTYVEGNGTDHISDLENLYYTYVTSPLLNEQFRLACAKWDKAAVGRPSPDFCGTDVNGKQYSVRDFRGKYVYIDMWATWCGPCQKELPFLKQLEEKYHDRNIVFLGLSIDKNVEKWKQRVASGALCGTQLHIGTGTSFQKDYKIGGIPHFILLDPNGRIVNPNMTRPSSEDTEKILNSLQGL